MMLRMKLVAGAAAVSLLFFGAVLTTGSLISEVSYFTRGKEQVQQRKAISGSTAKRLIRRGFFHRRLCYLYGMCSSFFLRLRAGAFLCLMTMSQAASTQPLADPAMWTEIHDRLGAPVLLAFAVAAFSLLVVYRSARSEVRRRQQIELETELERERLNAILNRAGSVRIVHGMGTGALRKAIQQHLKRIKYVKSFRQGEYGEGDAGVTIVEFKK